jgi:hypothetical protein
MLACLKLLPQEEKEKYWNKTDNSYQWQAAIKDLKKLPIKPLGLLALPVAEKVLEEAQFEFGAGILMHEGMPDNIRRHILGFLPLMKNKMGENQADKYLNLVNERELKKGKLQMEISEEENKLTVAFASVNLS